MYRFLITRRSANPKTGPLMVTTSEKRTCPLVCPLRKETGTDTVSACYAETGLIGTFLWKELKRTPIGKTFKHGKIKVRSAEELYQAIRALSEGTLWRHNQAGDLPSDDRATIDGAMVDELVEANRGRRGFTYTHFDVRDNLQNREIVRRADENGFTINLSANDLAHADQLVAVGCGPVASVVAPTAEKSLVTPNGHKVVVCPATRVEGVNCKNCGLCYTQRRAIVGFPAYGHNRQKLAISAAA